MLPEGFNIMEVLYVSSMCSKAKFNNLFNQAIIKPAQQAQKYHRLIAEGLVAQRVSIEALSSVPLNRSMSNMFYHKNEKEEVNGIKYRYLPFVNLPIARQLFLFITCFFYSLIWCNKHKKGVIICDVLDVSISSASLLASKLMRTSSLGIVTDIPAFLNDMMGNTTIISRVLVLINTFILYYFDLYIFLTEQMNELINKKSRPYVVIEGQVDINMGVIQNDLIEKYKDKICLYAGALHKIYGLKTFTEAFIAANIEGTQLHIYGSGDFEEELKSICKEHHGIKYFGVVPNDVVVKEQLKATLLINPRPTNEEYTKYSFPSKNMEYMVSGTPLLTTCLSGMPKEYEQYIYLIEDETMEGIANKLKEVLSKSREELHCKGQDAKQFVMENKNNVAQAKKIMQMITEAIMQ